MEWLTVDNLENCDEKLKRASRCLLEGGIVVYPTETFYGLGALALNEDAVTRVFLQKQRPLEKQLTVLIPDMNTLEKYVVKISPMGKLMAEKFWPGPLTLVLEAKSQLLNPLKATTPRVGFRISSHPVAHKLTQFVKVPITATSANPSGLPPVTDPKDLPSDFLDGIDVVLDAGRTPGGAASTILDVTYAKPRIIREGALAEKVKKICFAYQD